MRDAHVLAQQILSWVTRILCINVAVLFRFSLGERFLSNDVIILALIMVFIWPKLASEVTSISGEKFATLLTLYFSVLAIAFIFQKVLIWRRNRKGVRWHSYSPGISWFYLLMPKPLKKWITHQRVQYYVEPLMCVVLFWFLTGLDPMLAIYMLFSGLALFFVGQLHREEMRKKYLDMVDKSIEAEILVEMMEGKEAKRLDYNMVYDAVNPEQTQYVAGDMAVVNPDVNRLVKRIKERYNSSMEKEEGNPSHIVA